MVRRKRNYDHGCAIDPDQVEKDDATSSSGDSSNGGGVEPQGSMESNMFVTMVSCYIFFTLNLSCMILICYLCLQTAHLHIPSLLSDYLTQVFLC